MKNKTRETPGRRSSVQQRGRVGVSHATRKCPRGATRRRRFASTSTLQAPFSLCAAFFKSLLPRLSCAKLRTMRAPWLPSDSFCGPLNGELLPVTSTLAVYFIYLSIHMPCKPQGLVLTTYPCRCKSHLPFQRAPFVLAPWASAKGKQK